MYHVKITYVGFVPDLGFRLGGNMGKGQINTSTTDKGCGCCSNIL